MRNGAIPMETSTYQISDPYCGWSFGIDPSGISLNGGCPRT
jgi:hypothetical protein